MCAPAAWGQYNASIQGTVTDPQNAVVTGATVTLTNTETNQIVTRTTSGAGVFTFNQLPPSTYTIVVTKDGFTRKEVDNVAVQPEQANALNVKLLAAGASTNVTVSGSEAATLDTETATVGGTVTANQIQHLPSFGRDVFQLSQLAPGSFGDGAQAKGGGSSSLPSSDRQGSAASAGIFQTENAPQISGNGGQNGNNGISINGISTVSAVWGGASVITPSEDSVKDVHIVSNGYDASSGRFSSTQMQVITKNGTNQVHGSGFFKADRPGLNAYQRLNGPSSFVGDTPAARGLNRDNQQFNQFGGTIGGPLWKNKIFAFFAYEGLRDSTSTTGQGWFEAPEFASIPGQAPIAGQYLGFPGEAPNYTGVIARNCASISLTEGTNCRTLPNGELNLGSPRPGAAPGTLDPTWVSSQVPGIGGGLANTPTIAFLNTVNPSNVVEDQYNGRLDVQAGANDLVTFTIYWVPTSTTSYNGPVRAANLWHHQAINDAFTGIWDHTFSPTLVNEARANAAGYRWNELTTNPQAPFGLPTAKVDNLGAMGTTNGISGNNFGPPGPSNLNQWTFGYEDTLTKVLARHQVKMGGEVTRLYYLNNPIAGARPEFDFHNLWDFSNDAPYQEIGSFSPTSGQVSVNRQDMRSDLYGLFVQDDYKLKPNLTINLGLRWSYFGPVSSKQNNLGVFRQGPAGAALSNASVRVGGNLYDPQVLNFGPQLGFAWSPEQAQGKMVFRGGFGMSFNQEELAISTTGANNPPLITNAQFCCSTGNPGVIDPSILYTTSGDTHSLFGYPSNPAAIQQFNNNLPVAGSAPISVNAFPSRIPTNYTYHYSFDTQYQFAPNWVATIGYQGSTSRHLIREFNENVVAIAQGQPLNPQLQTVNFFGNDGNSNYSALLTTLRHNFSKGFQVEGQYSWSKSMDQGSHPYYEDPYPYDPKLAWGRSDYNVGNAFKVFGLWQPTFFRGGHNWLEKTVGGWSVSGILNIHTGFPWTAVYSNVGNGAYYSGSGYTSFRPAAYLGGAGNDTSNDAFLSGPQNPKEPVNRNFSRGALAYFTVPNIAPGPQFSSLPAPGPLPQTPGVARNTLNGPNYIDADMTLSKAFGLPNNRILGDNSQIEVRANAYNIYNRLNLDGTSISNTISSDGTTSSANFGQAQSALGSRTIEMQARFSF